jgi:hypothetical protein
LEKQAPHNKHKSVLLDADYATTHYTARFFYVQQKMKMWNREKPGHLVIAKRACEKVGVEIGIMKRVRMNLVDLCLRRRQGIMKRDK